MTELEDAIERLRAWLKIVGTQPIIREGQPRWQCVDGQTVSMRSSFSDRELRVIERAIFAIDECEKHHDLQNAVER